MPLTDMFYAFVAGLVLYIPFIFMLTESKVFFFEAYAALTGKSPSQVYALFDILRPYEQQMILRFYEKRGYTQQWRFTTLSHLKRRIVLVLSVIIQTLFNLIGMALMIEVLLSVQATIYEYIVFGFFVLLGAATILYRVEIVVRLMLTPKENLLKVSMNEEITPYSGGEVSTPD